MRYRTLQDGQWADDAPDGLAKIACCDCGLVHLVQFKRLRAGGVKYRAWRDVKATAARRKRKGLKP